MTDPRDQLIAHLTAEVGFLRGLIASLTAQTQSSDASAQEPARQSQRATAGTTRAVAQTRPTAKYAATAAAELRAEGRAVPDGSRRPVYLGDPALLEPRDPGPNPGAYNGGKPRKRASSARTSAEMVD